MKYIKKFENIKEEPQLGDYVLVQIDLNMVAVKDKVNNFTNSNIGKIVHISKVDYGRKNMHNLYLVQCENVPLLLKRDFITRFDFKNCLPIHENEILSFGKTPEDVQMKLKANKYNI
jgi:hypothetical protein